MRSIRLAGIAAIALLALGGCASQGPEMETVNYVDLDKFMGRWYVIANIPTFIEKGAHNAVETYELNDDGTIATTFTFRKGDFDGKLKEYNPRGFVLDTESNARWGMRFIWPLKSDYRVVYLDDDYATTVIGRQARDFLWIMARTPTIPDDRYREIVEFTGELGYDTSKIVRVPQRW